MVPNVRFNELLADIEPSPTTELSASAAHTAVRNHLKSHKDFKARWVRAFLAGSYARHTAIRPKTTVDGIERADVDIIIVTNFTTADSPEDALGELKAALEDGFAVERLNKRSVRIKMANAEIDVVLVLESGPIFKIADRDLGGWKDTDPPGHTSWSSDQNTAFGERFKPLVKLFKWWRRENRSGKRPKGFILECLIAESAPSGEPHFGEAIAQMLEKVYNDYGALADLGLKPTISDPALPGSDILSKVSITDWKNFIEKVRVHAEYARRAQDEEDMEEATRLWRRLFGGRFKSTQTPAKEASSGLTKAAAVGSPSYVFPNADAAPKKPRGFA